MICWLLYKVFPNEEDLNRFKIEKLEKKNIHYTKTLYLDKYVSEMPGNAKNSLRMEESIFRKRIHLSKSLYQFIKFCCLNNEENQNYFLQFIGFYSNHIGYGSFVTSAFETCLGSNEKILKELSNYNMNTLDICEEAGRGKHKSFISNILYKFKKFPLYEKADILKLLAKFCLSEDENSIYKNQEIIFQTFNNDEELYYMIFMKIYSSSTLLDQKIYVELGGNNVKKGKSFSLEDIGADEFS